MNMVMSYIGFAMMCYRFYVIPHANYNVVPKIIQLWWAHMKRAPRLQVLFANQVCVMNKMEKAKQPSRKQNQPSPNKRTTNKVVEVNDF